VKARLKWRKESEAVKKKALFVTDPQVDFCSPSGSLYVPGAEEDCARIAEHIDRRGEEYARIFVTLDVHTRGSIFFPEFWEGVDDAARRPEPFTGIDLEMYLKGGCAWVPRNPVVRAHVVSYFRELAAKGEREFTIWPIHCIAGTEGANIHPSVALALERHTVRTGRPLDLVFKGYRPYVEQYSAYMPEVETVLVDGDIREIVLCGEALSHCVLHTAGDMREALARRGYSVAIDILDGCSSIIPGFETATRKALASLRIGTAPF
jgi:nicotinamidase/pyrazinamidase